MIERILIAQPLHVTAVVEKQLDNTFIFRFRESGTARTQVPTTKNCALDIPTLGVFARFSST